jgi:hypothetical protein
MTLNFSKFFEQHYTNHHSFGDLLSLAKEVCDYVYNHDVIKSDYFDSFKETKTGFKLNFNREGKKNYTINAVKKKVTDQEGNDQIIDSVYEDIENLYDIIKNYEIMVNIKQMDEKVKSFNGLISQSQRVYDERDPFGEEDWNDGEEKPKKTFKTMDLRKSLIEIMNSNEGLKSFKQVNPSVNEAITDELRDKVSNTYTSLKRGILELLDKQLDGDITKVQDFIDSYVNEDSEEVLEGFIEDADIFDFYLKYQNDVDQILADNDFYDEEVGVESLYGYVIEGTFAAVVMAMEAMQNEIYGNE